MTKLTQARLKELLRYDPTTGLFTLVKAPRSLVIDGRQYRVRDLLWLWKTGALPQQCIVHLNSEKSDFRFCNLAQASASQIRAMRKPWGRSGRKGVYKTGRVARPWRAQIYQPSTVKGGRGKNKSLGCYATREEAEAVSAEAYSKMYGEFGRP